MRVLILFLAFGCSLINQDSREHYSGKGIKYQHKSSFRTPPKDQYTYDPNPSKKTILAGKKLYRESCVHCHGDKAHGDGPLAEKLDQRPANLQSIMSKAPNFQLYLSISKWYGNMPGWKERTYTEEEILQIGYYIRSLE